MKKITMPKIYTVLGSNIVKYRNLKNLSDLQLADAVGISHDLIKQLESGNPKKSISIETLSKIAQVLNVSVIHLLEQDH